MCRRLVVLSACFACLFAVYSPCLGAQAQPRRGLPQSGLSYLTSVKCLDPDTGTTFAPLGLAFDVGGHLYLIDSDNSRVLSISDFAAGPAFFAACPEARDRCQWVDVIADAGLFYVSDRAAGKITVLDSEGSLVYGRDVGPGMGGLGLGRAGQVYAAMTVSGAIVVADVLGETSPVTCPISDGGEGSYPLDCLVSQSGKVLVTDALSKKVLVLSLLGKRLGNLEGFNFKSPFGISNYLDRMVLVSDSELGVVAVFDSAGKFLDTFGKGRLKTPTFLAVRDDGTICVSDVGKMTIEVFRINGPTEE